MPDPYLDVVVRELAQLLERSRVDDLPQLLWTTSLTMIESSTERTRNWHWWRNEPRGELRRLRSRIAEALALARLAAALQEADNAGEWESSRPEREAAEIEGARRRRAQTMPAELARLAKAAGARSKP